MTGPASDVHARVAAATGREATRVAPLGHRHAWELYRVVLADGTDAFAKAVADPDLDGLFHAEARGLAWLGLARGAPVPDVLGWDAGILVLSWVEEAPPTADAAERLGRDLAAMHAAGADTFGTDWDGYIGPLPLDNTPDDDWPRFYAERRLAPYLRQARDRGVLDAADTRLLERVIAELPALAGAPEPPARIHGDLWGGNVLWRSGGATLVDPAAHGGHRETDLAMLDLFGLPHLSRVLAAYDEAAPLADGWRQRVPLHQLHPLLVHVCLFGAGYREQTVAAARAALRG